jgi:hypothetical protein
VTRQVSAPAAAAAEPAPWAELRPLFHQLNNQLGIILAHAELLEAKAASEPERQRASQIVTSALDAMMTVRSLRDRQERPESRH